MNLTFWIDQGTHVLLHYIPLLFIPCNWLKGGSNISLCTRVYTDFKTTKLFFKSNKRNQETKGGGI